MTSIGLTILDYLIQSLNFKYPHGKWLLSERDAEILFENIYFLADESPVTEKELATKFKLTSKRIGQIRIHALMKVIQAARRGRIPAFKIIGIIQKYTKTQERKKMKQVIADLYFNEMPEMPGELFIPFLALLYFGKKADARSTYEHFTIQRKNQLIEQKRSISGERQKLKKEAILKDELVRNIIWLGLTKKWTKEQFIGKEPKRKINHDERYNSGEIESQKCGRAIQYESNVELSFIKKLEENPSVIYYLEQPTTIYYNKKDKEHYYTPDFAVLLEDGRCFLVEVKYGYNEMVDSKMQRRIEALISFCEKNGMGLLLTNGKHSLDYLMNYPCNATGLEDALLKKLNERGGRTIFFKEYIELMQQFKAKKIEFLSLVLKHDWGYYSIPFRLTLKTSYPIFREKIINRLKENHQIKSAV